jgi:hypothetical protein
LRQAVVVALVLSVSGFGTAFAQSAVSTGMAAPIGITSPLGIGPGTPVTATGIPLGATELATPGVSPSTSSNPSPGSMTAATTTTTACSAGSSTIGSGATMSGESPATGGVSGPSVPTPLFDGAGISGTASGTCANATASTSPTGSASSPTLASRSMVGRVGIPMGSTELATGGLSPLPDITMQSQAPIVSTGTSTVPCPTTGMSSATGTTMSSSGC